MLSERDLYISWLYNNEDIFFSDDVCVDALIEYDIYKNYMSIEEIKESVILSYGEIYSF